MRILIIRSTIILLTVLASHLSSASQTIDLKLGGTPESFNYISLVLTRALEASGYNVRIENVGEVPTTRLEVMMGQGEVSCFIMGQTKIRDENFLAVHVGMTDNLMGHRILFIHKGSQHEYEGVTTLDEFRALGKVAGMGQFWGDVAIWNANALPVYTLGGDWKNLFKMVASGSRGVDYLSRGVQEIVTEWRRYPDLEVEQHLVFVYQKDHILYVTPKDPELFDLLERVLMKAEASGVIAKTAREYYEDIYHFPVNLANRRKIELVLP